jgi:hypothetical protein
MSKIRRAFAFDDAAQESNKYPQLAPNVRFLKKSLLFSSELNYGHTWYGRFPKISDEF